MLLSIISPTYNEAKNVEKLDLTKDDATWEELNVTLPKQISKKHGFVCLPAWKTSSLLSKTSDQSVLIFGGKVQAIFQYIINEDKIINLSNDDASADLYLDEKDFFYGQPHLVGNDIVLLGQSNI